MKALKLTANVLLTVLKCFAALFLTMIIIFIILGASAVADERSRRSGFTEIYVVDTSGDEEMLAEPWRWAFKRTFK